MQIERNFRHGDVQIYLLTHWMPRRMLPTEAGHHKVAKMNAVRVVDRQLPSSSESWQCSQPSIGSKLGLGRGLSCHGSSRSSTRKSSEVSRAATHPTPLGKRRLTSRRPSRLGPPLRSAHWTTTSTTTALTTLIRQHRNSQHHYSRQNFEFIKRLWCHNPTPFLLVQSSASRLSLHWHRS